MFNYIFKTLYKHSAFLYVVSSEILQPNIRILLFITCLRSPLNKYFIYQNLNYYSNTILHNYTLKFYFSCNAKFVDVKSRFFISKWITRMNSPTCACKCTRRVLKNCEETAFTLTFFKVHINGVCVCDNENKHLQLV